MYAFKNGTYNLLLSLNTQMTQGTHKWPSATSSWAAWLQSRPTSTQS